MTTGTAEPATYGHDPSLPRVDVAYFQWMIESGVLTSSDKVEFLEGWVVPETPRNARHDGTIDLVKAAFAHLPVGRLLRVQQTLVLTDSQPEPDFSVVRGGPRSYLTQQPTAAETALVIEVADSSLLRDQRDKTRIYARAGVPVYWIINLVDRRIEVYMQPSGPTAVPAYGAFQTYQPGDMVPLVLDGAIVGSVPAADLLP